MNELSLKINQLTRYEHELVDLTQSPLVTSDEQRVLLGILIKIHDELNDLQRDHHISLV